MPKAAYCADCAGYVWIGKDGGCVNGHAASHLLGDYEAQQDTASGKPVPPVPRCIEPQEASAKHAAEVLGAGAASLAVAASGRFMNAAANLATSAGQKMQSAAEQLSSPRLPMSSVPEEVTVSDASPLGKALGPASSPVGGSAEQAHGATAADSLPPLTPTPPKPMRTLTKVVVGLFLIHGGLTLIAAVVLGVARLMYFGQRYESGFITSAFTLASQVGSLQSIAWLGTFVAFLFWLYRISKNLHGLVRGPMKFSPGWTVGWYFVPVAMFFKPYQAMKEIWLLSHGASKSSLVLPKLWFGLFVTGIVAGRLSAAMLGVQVDWSGYAVSRTLMFGGDLILVASSIASLLLVRRIGEAYAVNLGEGSQAVAPAQGFGATGVAQD